MRIAGKPTWDEIYGYYRNRGLTLFVSEGISNFLIGSVITFAPVFMFGMCNWSAISASSDISQVIFPFTHGWRRTPFFIKLCSIMFGMFNLLQFGQFLSSLKSFFGISEYFTKKLKIKDRDLESAQWTEVVDAVLMCDTERNISLLEIAQVVLKFDNYLCAMHTDPNLFTWTLPGSHAPKKFPITSFFDYFFKVAMDGTCLQHDGSSKVNGLQSMQIQKATSSLKFRFTVIGWLSLLLTPFILSFQLLYMFFWYIQTIRSSPERLAFRRYSHSAKWELREYNELPHIFEERLERSSEFANLFLDMFPSHLLQLAARTAAFLCGSVIGISLVIGLLSDVTAFLQITIAGEKTVAWFLTIAAGVFAAARSLTTPPQRDFSLDQLLEKVQKHLHIDLKDNFNSSHSSDVEKRLNTIFQPLWLGLLTEIAGVFLNPFIFLYILPSKSRSIIEFIRNNSTYIDDIGWVCTFSVFHTLYDAKKPPMSHVQSEKCSRSMLGFNIQTIRPASPPVLYQDDTTNDLDSSSRNEPLMVLEDSSTLSANDTNLSPADFSWI